MFRLDHYSFGKRLGAGFAIIIFLLLAVFAEGLRGRWLIEDGINQLNVANVGVREVFGLQVLENSYLNSRDPIYAQRFKKWHKVNLDNFMASKHLFNSALNKPLVQRFEAANIEYGKEFELLYQQVTEIQSLTKKMAEAEQRWSEKYNDDSAQLLLVLLGKMRSETELSLDPNLIDQWQAYLSQWANYVTQSEVSSYLTMLSEVDSQLQSLLFTRDKMLKAATDVRDSAKQILVNVELQMAEDKQLSTIVGLVVCISALIASFIIGFVITRSVIRPIKSTIHIVEKLAKGELYHQLSCEGRDELASLSEAINNMTNSLRNMVGDTSQNLNLLNRGSSELNSIAEDNNSGAQKQLSESEMVASAMTQMSATMTEISSHVSEVAESAGQSQQLIESCNQVTATAIEDINQLSINISDASEVVDHLAQQSENISSVLGVINSISDQINLLALNAAIEAARAGEQGRGFAVVADEVRALAQHTQKSTREIDAIIGALRHNAGKAVTAMNDSQQSVESSRQQVQGIGSHLVSVSDLVNNVTEQAISLSSASVEQSVTAESFNDSMHVIVGISRESSDTAQQLATTATQLLQCKDEINYHMAKFQLS